MTECDDEYMQSRNTKPGVTFSIELRPFTSIQLEAGKRLFSRLLVRTQTKDKEKSAWKK